MEEGYNKLEEFYRASNTCQPIRVSSHGDNSDHAAGSLYKTTTAENNVEASRKSFVRGRSSTMYCSAKCMVGKGITPNMTSKGEMITKSTFLFKPTASFKNTRICPASSMEETKFMPGAPIKAFSMTSASSDPYIDSTSKSRSTTDSEMSRIEAIMGQKDSFVQAGMGGSLSNAEELKEKLTASLSPSPFRDDDPFAREAKLDQLMGAGTTTKNLIFSPFYSSELAEENGHHAWKIALKDHIVHTLESICIIKKLKPVPSEMIEKKRLPLDPKPSSKTL